MAKQLLTETEMSELLNLSVHTLRADRRDKRLIPFIKFRGSIRYDLERVEAALSSMENGGPKARPAARGEREPRTVAA